MPGAGDHASGAVAERLNRPLAARQTLRVESDRGVVKNPFNFGRDAAPGQFGRGAM